MTRLLIYILLTALFSRTFILTINSSQLDFQYYLESANLFLTNQNPYQNLLYPPASLLLFTPFTLPSFSIAKMIWSLLSLASLYFGLSIFLKQLRSKSTDLLLIYLFSIQLFPVKFSLALGQINLILFLGYAIFYYSFIKKQELLSGLSLSLITILKFNPLFFIPFLLIYKKYKTLLVFVTSFAALNLATDIFSSYNLNSLFVQSIIDMSQNFSGYYYNQSLSAFISRLLINPSSARNAVYFFSGLLWLVTIISTLKSKNSTNSFFLFLITIIITSPLSWQHHLVLTLPIFIHFFLKDNPLKPITPRTILLFTSFILINLNLKDPTQVPSQSLLYSHAFVGLLLLYLVSLFRNIKE